MPCTIRLCESYANKWISHHTSHNNLETAVVSLSQPPDCAHKREGLFHTFSPSLAVSLRGQNHATLLQRTIWPCIVWDWASREGAPRILWSFQSSKPTNICVQNGRFSEHFSECLNILSGFYCTVGQAYRPGTKRCVSGHCGGHKW